MPERDTMQKKTKTLGTILKAGFLPNLINDALDPVKLVEAVLSAGVGAMEISCRRPDTLEKLGTLKHHFPDMCFGVSSLIEDGPYYDFLQKRGPRFPSIAQAVDAGADFLVSILPFSAEIHARYPQRPIIPGVETAAEAKAQLDLGASLIKFCNPVMKGGPAYIKSISGGPIHFGLPLLLTGGMRPELIGEYVEAGMLVAVAGFDLILGERYEEMQEHPDYEAVTHAIEGYVEAFRKARATHMPEVGFASGDAFQIQSQSGKFMNVSE